MIAGGALLIAATGGAAAPVLVTLGAGIGAVQLGVGIYKSNTATTDAEAEQAWQGIGAGTSAITLSALGAKSALKAAGINAEEMSVTKATAECIKMTPKAIDASEYAILTKAGNFINNSNPSGGLMPVLAVAGKSGQQLKVQFNGKMGAMSETSTVAVVGAAEPSALTGVIEAGLKALENEDGKQFVDCDEKGNRYIIFETKEGELYKIRDLGDNIEIYDIEGKLIKTIEKPNPAIKSIKITKNGIKITYYMDGHIVTEGHAVDNSPIKSIITSDVIKSQSWRKFSDREKFVKASATDIAQHNGKIGIREITGKDAEGQKYLDRGFTHEVKIHSEWRLFGRKLEDGSFLWETFEQTKLHG